MPFARERHYDDAQLDQLIEQKTGVKPGVIGPHRPVNRIKMEPVVQQRRVRENQQIVSAAKEWYDDPMKWARAWMRLYYGKQALPFWVRAWYSVVSNDRRGTWTVIVADQSGTTIYSLLGQERERFERELKRHRGFDDLMATSIAMTVLEPVIDRFVQQRGIVLREPEGRKR